VEYVLHYLNAFLIALILATVLLLTWLVPRLYRWLRKSAIPYMLKTRMVFPSQTTETLSAGEIASLKKPTPEDPAIKMFRPRFNQRSGTLDAALRPNSVRRYASCHCFDPQYKADEKEHSGEENVRPAWHELLFHPEVQDIDSDAWKSVKRTSRRFARKGPMSLIRGRESVRNSGSRLSRCPKRLGR
jgi:hypothetical protein